MFVRERLYTIRQLAELWFGRENWKQQYSTIRRWFIDQKGNPIPGVLNAGARKKNKALRIPGFIAQAEYESRGGRL